MSVGDSSAVAIGPFQTISFTSDSGLLIEATVAADSPIVSSFFAAYDEAFVLPNEKERFDGFVECMRLNEGADYAWLSARYGPYREVVLVARDGEAGTPVGGANFIAFPLARPAPVLSLNLNYIYVVPAARGRGHLKRLLESVGEAAAAFYTPAAASLPRLTFIEQNDPVKMSREDYERDTAFTGLDQFARIGIWSRLGARIVDFGYIQPPLSANQDPDHALVYAVLGAARDTLSSCLLHDHLERFFGISVLKGADLRADATASAQLAGLSRDCSAQALIPLLRMPAGALHTPPAGDGGSNSRSLRDVWRERAQA